MKKTNLKPIIILLLLSFVVSSCTLVPDKPKPPIKPATKDDPSGSVDTIAKTPSTISEKLLAQSSIKKFEDYDELREFLENNQSSSGGYGMDYGIRSNMVFEESMAVSDGISGMDTWGAPTSMLKQAADTSGTSAGGAEVDYSKTNVQVEGVDEADIIKTDGEYIYALVKQNLFIVKAYPGEKGEVISMIKFESRPQDIFINEDTLAVFGANQQIYNTDLYKRFRRRSTYTFFKVFDISDPKNPEQIKNLDFEGSYQSARMIGDWVYFVTNNYNYYYIEDELPMPRIIEDGEVITGECANCIQPAVYYFDMPYNNYNFTSVSAINIANPESDVASEVYMLTSNQNMFVSQNNMYITYTKYISEYDLEMEVMREIVLPRLSAKDQEKIIKIGEVENFILSVDEKRRKIQVILERYGESLTDDERNDLEEELEEKMKQKYEDISKELEKTVIHKIAIDKGSLEYKTYGEVTGHVLNQFSMDEKDGYFRIATTKNRTWSRFEDGRTDSYNNMYVLDEDLEVVGALENLAEGERIYSVRFMQDRAYMVTFKQTDPLFTIDLSNPRNPKVLGQLKIPGFSNYLHPYDDETLIGIGKETEENEWGGVVTKGVKISLFDVSDVESPSEIDKYELGDRGSDSIALNDHHAFLFSKEKNLLVLPVSIRESKDGRSYGKLTFSGAAVFNIDKEDGIEVIARIDHSDGGKESVKDYWRGYNYYDNTVKRSLYIEDSLYTFSNKYIKINDLEDDLDEIKEIELKMKKTGSDFEIIN